MPLLTNKVVWQSHFVAPDAPVAPDAASRVNQFMQTRDPLTLGHIFMPNPPCFPGQRFNITHTSHKPLTKHAIQGKVGGAVGGQSETFLSLSGIHTGNSKQQQTTNKNRANSNISHTSNNSLWSLA